jgi:hypothetical protein
MRFPHLLNHILLFLLRQTRRAGQTNSASVQVFSRFAANVFIVPVQRLMHSEHEFLLAAIWLAGEA